MAYGMKKDKMAAKKAPAKKAAAKKGAAKANGLTASQKKLPPFIQKAIMNKKKSK